jgi:hypothetical protein
VLGKLAATLAPPEPQLQHAALRLSTRRWETAPLPAPDGLGAVGVALTPSRAVGEVTRELLGSVTDLAGPVEFDPTPEDVAWSAPLDADEEHATYEVEQVASYFAAATRAAQVLAAFRAPHPGRSTPVSARWGSFDVAVSLLFEDS